MGTELITRKGRTTSGVTGERLSEEKFGLHVITEAAGVAWDEINVMYPTNASESYAYSFEGSVVRTVVITYTDSSKQNLLKIERS